MTTKNKQLEAWKRMLFPNFHNLTTYDTLPTDEILSGKNERAWVSMVLYLKK